MVASRRPNICEALRHAEEILSDERLLRWCAGLSCQHPNGFVKVVLFDSPDGGRSRLHYWPSAAHRDHDEDIHTHRWQFNSVVLRGEFEEHWYRVRDGGPDFVGMCVKADPDRELRQIRSVTIEEIGSVPAAKGKWTVRSYQRFHRLICVDPRPALTLVQTDPAQQGFSLVARFEGSDITVDPGCPVDIGEIEAILGGFVRTGALAA